MGLDLGLVFSFEGEGERVLAPGLALPVQAYFDCFPVQDAVATVDTFPQAGGTQLRRGDRGLCAEAVQVLIRHEAGMAAADRVRCGAALQVVGGPGHHVFLAVKGILGPHEDEADVLQVLIVVSGLAAHRP